MGTTELWELMVAMVYRTPDGLRERSVRCLCTATDLIDAAQSAKRYSEWLHRNWLYGENESDAFVGCIKVYPKRIGPVTESGAPEEALGWGAFEWKYDWPGSLDEYIRMKEQGQARHI